MHAVVFGIDAMYKSGQLQSTQLGHAVMSLQHGNVHGMPFIMAATLLSHEVEALIAWWQKMYLDAEQEPAAWA